MSRISLSHAPDCPRFSLGQPPEPPARTTWRERIGRVCAWLFVVAIWIMALMSAGDDYYGR